MGLSGPPVVANNWAVTNHNANHHQIDHRPHTAAQLHGRQCVSADLAGHVNICYVHADHCDLAEYKWSGKAPERRHIIYKRRVIGVFEKHCQHNFWLRLIFV